VKSVRRGFLSVHVWIECFMRSAEERAHKVEEECWFFVC
jgi:hypothetical protein